MAESNYEIAAAGAAEVTAPDLPYAPKLPDGYRPNLALIACGGITEWHLKAYAKGGLPVVAYADLDLSRAEARRDAYSPGAMVTTDFREVLRRDDVEVVDIAAHPAERPALVREALLAGKHVLSQKPFVLDLDEGERLVELAASRGLRLAVNQNGRWAPHFSYLRQAIQAGLIGEVLAAHFAVHWNHDWVAGTPFDEVKHVVLYDFAIHWFDALTSFMGDRGATSVFASTSHARGQSAKPDLLGQAQVTYEGAQASLVFDAYVRYGSRDTTFVAGTLGTLESVGPDLGKQSVTLTTEAGAASPTLEGAWFPDGFLGTMGELLCAIAENREPSNSAADNLRGLALCFAALRSADTGEPQVPGRVRSVG